LKSLSCKSLGQFLGGSKSSFAILMNLKEEVEEVSEWSRT
jgi:hypothetical protein